MELITRQLMRIGRGVPMSDKSWKRLERKAASLLHGKRIPSSGSGAIKGDVLHPKLLIECKYREKLPITKWFGKVKIQAISEQKTPLLILKQKGKHGELAVLELEDFIKILKERRCSKWK
jgi:hypothetical protein